MKTQHLTMIELLILLFVIAVAVVMISPAFHHHGHHRGARRANCSGNLKQMGVALLMYSGDFSGYFPPTGEGNSFEPLNSTGYLHDSKVYRCPSSGTERETAADSDYWYIGGGLRDDNEHASDQRLAFDMFNNHDDNEWVNALFVDGHVEGGKPARHPRFKNDDAVVKPPKVNTP